MIGARRPARVVGALLAVVFATTLFTGASIPPDDEPSDPPPPSHPYPDDPVDPVRAEEYWLDALGIRTAWETTRGAGQTIAVIDTGIAAGPPEFNGAVSGGTDVSGVGAAAGRSPVGTLNSDHGSWVASLAAGRGTGTGGMVGVAPDAMLLSISIGFGASATVPFVDQVAEAMVWAVDNGADIINLSFTTNALAWDQSWDTAFQYAFEHDVVVIVAAGNRGSGTSRVGAPATIPGVLTVGGVDPEGNASVEASTQGITIGVSAPSERLLGVSSDGRIIVWDGTSGAAPIVAGIAALVKSAHPELDSANVINRIIQTARPAPAASGRPDPLYGYGIVDAAAAVSAQVPLVDANPMGNLAEWIRLYRRADSAPGPQQPTTELPPVAALPPAEAPSSSSSPLLPSAETLKYGTVPLAGATVAGILVALGVAVAVRRVRSARTRTPSNPPPQGEPHRDRA